MRLDDAEKYRSSEVNADLHRVYHGNQLIGQVRRGMDHHWYPELPAEKYKMAALHKVILAHEAIEDFNRAVNGSG